MAKPPKKPDKSEDDLLWPKVAKTVTPLRPGSAKPVSREAFSSLMRLPPLPRSAPLVPPHDPGINQDKKVRRGRVDIDAKIDLHDMTRAQAFPALKGAIIRAYNRNMSCLLVVTGKGTGLRGVLRTSFQDWLKDSDIRPFIASYAQAHIKHGGSGAWYVFLKR